jgi:hypothetical protein
MPRSQIPQPQNAQRKAARGQKKRAAASARQKELKLIRSLNRKIRGGQEVHGLVSGGFGDSGTMEDVRTHLIGAGNTVKVYPRGSTCILLTDPEDDASRKIEIKDKNKKLIKTVDADVSAN